MIPKNVDYLITYLNRTCCLAPGKPHPIWVALGRTSIKRHLYQTVQILRGCGGDCADSPEAKAAHELGQQTCYGLKADLLAHVGDNDASSELATWLRGLHIRQAEEKYNEVAQPTGRAAFLARLQRLLPEGFHVEDAGPGQMVLRLRRFDLKRRWQSANDNVTVARRAGRHWQISYPVDATRHGVRRDSEHCVVCGIDDLDTAVKRRRHRESRDHAATLGRLIEATVRKLPGHSNATPTGETT